jgi:iron complex outermembrane receptor protein
VFGENLLNKQYMTANQPYGMAADGTPLSGATYARGAVVGIGASVRF